MCKEFYKIFAIKTCLVGKKDKANLSNLIDMRNPCSLSLSLFVSHKKYTHDKLKMTSKILNLSRSINDRFRYTCQKNRRNFSRTLF